MVETVYRHSSLARPDRFLLLTLGIKDNFGLVLTGYSYLTIFSLYTYSVTYF
jgi:hypothetical protein